MSIGISEILGDFTMEAAEKIDEIISSGIKEGASATNIIGQLKEAGLSYRRIDMLSDIREYGALKYVPEEDASKAGKALEYFRNVVEPYRQAKGISVKSAWDRIHKYENQEYSSDDEEIDIESDALDYAFDTTP